ncbi:VPA1269 family protein [Cupriavidus sp. D39]|uniref:VPA1269 family protein n=1 Tax=Cupriavidus sp. D39 TaxID=2997877 RepID=UPI00226FD72F|nr:VPA1269 family protein [Cupriavidus sp. D39]MCY0857564.1 VPA1269 family protein [Cupriavidus sp. D39]
MAKNQASQSVGVAHSCQKRLFSLGIGIDVEPLLEMEPRDCVDALLSALSYPTQHIRSGDDRPNWILNEGFKNNVLQIIVFLHHKDILLASFRTYSTIRKANSTSNGAGRNVGSLVSALEKLGRHYNMPSYTLFKRIAEHSDKSDIEGRINVAWFILSTNIDDIGDLSAELLQHLVDARLGPQSYIKLMWRAFRATSEYASLANELPYPKGASKSADPEARCRSLRWMLEDYPQLEVWIRLGQRFLDALYIQNNASRVYDLQKWIYYLAQLGERAPLLPKNVVRKEHISPLAGEQKSNNTYREYLDALKITTGPTKDRPLSNVGKSDCMRTLKSLLDFHCQENAVAREEGSTSEADLLLVNPITDMDCKWRNPTRYKTKRKALDEVVLDELQSILLSKDNDGNPTFDWVRSHPSLSSDWVEVDSTPHVSWPWKMAREGRTILWQPSRVIAVYLLLEIPLRMHQVRWLDSGVGDGFLFDHSSPNPQQSNTKFAEQDRAFGIFQPDDTFLPEQTAQIGLHITTNKAGPLDSPEDVHFHIPWPRKEVYEILSIQRDWAFLLAETIFTRKITISDDDIAVHKNVVEFLDSYFPLFRDFDSKEGSLPISRRKIETLWLLLCTEGEKRLNEKGINIKLVTPANRKEGGLRCTYDCHSLRVSGITNLRVRGIPIDIISSLIGHSTIAITELYNKTPNWRVREEIQKAFARSLTDKDRDQIEALVRKAEDGTPLSLDELRRLLGPKQANQMLLGKSTTSDFVIGASSSWRWFGDGICPGASCDEGGIDGTPVLGGARRCGNCRFFLTGTAFTYQQAHSCNVLMSEIIELSSDLLSSRERKRKATLGKREYEDAAVMVGEIERKLDEVVGDWWGRLLLMQATLNASNQSDGESRNILITKADHESLSMVITKTSKFQLLAQISKSTEILQLNPASSVPTLQFRDMINALSSKLGAEPFIFGRFDEDSLAKTNTVAQALYELISADMTEADGADVFAKMEALTNSPDVVASPKLQASVRRVFQLIKSKPQLKSLNFNA